MTTLRLIPPAHPDRVAQLPLHRSRRYRRRLLLGFAFAFAVLLTVAGLVTHSLNGLIDDASRMDDTQHVIGELRSLLGAVADAETAQRGFAITGRESFLRPYYQSRVAIANNLQRIGRAIAAQPSQQAAYTELRRVVDEKVAYVDWLIELRRQQGDEAARAAIIAGDGQTKMDAVRRVAEGIIAAEAELLRERAERTSAAAAYSRMAVYGGAFAGTAVLLLIIYLVVTEARRRTQVEAQLGDANARLQRSMNELQQLHAEQLLLSKMSELLHSCRTLDEAYQVIERFLPQLFPQLNGALGMLNASGTLVDVVSAWGERQDTADQFAPEDCWALRRGRPHLVHSAAADIACAHVAGADHGCLCHPLLAQSEAGGLLFLSGPREALDEAGKRLAQAVSEQISLALANLRLQESLRMQSVRDPLTGLYNRRHMEASLERELARARRHGHNVSVLMCDIDHFKRFNDTYGHDAGDALLVEFGKLLRGAVRAEDVVCRYGGEEFVLILPDTDQDAAVRRADALREAVRRMRIRHRGTPLGEVTLSLGIGVYPQHGASPAALHKSADTALYAAKRGGRDRVCVAEPFLAYVPESL